jgi:hypothetical protein
MKKIFPEESIKEKVTTTLLKSLTSQKITFKQKC